MPDALEFLKPNKTFENSVDSLRDFIIALNKDKADHLRYKLVGDYVKIFITPYKSIISEKDFEFEQGDFNVDFVLAVGVTNQDNLDQALAAHGRIFHDASVGVLTVGENSSNLSEMNWHEPTASSISEMVLELIESDSIGKKSLTEPVATAILTGIVAETDRFSNAKTNANVMSLASKLITAGADQQLVVSKLKESEAKNEESPKPAKEPIDAQIETSSEEKPDQAEKDFSVLTIERDTTNEEPQEENTLVEDPELTEIKNLAVDFPAAQESVQPEEKIPAEPIDPAPNYEAEPSAPSENLTPELPEPATTFDQPTAFVAEQPVVSEVFEPAAQTEISPAPSEPEASPQPKFGAREYKDDYYHPDENRTMVNEMIQNSQILSHEQSSNSMGLENQPAYDQQANYPSATGKTLTPPTLGMMAENAPQQNFDQLSQNFENPSQNFGGFPPPVPDFSSMPLPPELPPVPNFGGVDFSAMPAPAQPINEQDFTFEPAQPAPDVAQGTQASANNIMTDQIYQDPAQFKIPGM